MSKITTVEELDALPMGAVVRCDDEEGIGLNVAERQPQGWQYVGSPIHSTSGQLAADEVPFTLLYRPDQPSDAARLRSGIEALADEWEREATDFASKPDQRNQGIAETLSITADRLRALLSTDDEKGGA